MDISTKEKYYFDKYNLISEVDPQNCGGTGCCSTCMYRKVDQSFENDYCVLSLSKKREKSRILDEKSVDKGKRKWYNSRAAAKKGAAIRSKESVA